MSRFGNSEILVADFYRRWRATWPPFLRPPYPAPRHVEMTQNAGFFPSNDDNLDRFARLYVEAAADIDILGVWSLRSEHRVIADCCPAARLVELQSLDCMVYKNPWSGQLAGRRVLVVHPFVDTIRSQYARRELLFDDPNVLPEFDLVTIKAVQSIAGSSTGYATWFAALDAMKEQIAATSFDIALIGAGAYGLPLAAFVKKAGKQAVHMGGITQLLFGIMGRRWEEEYDSRYRSLANAYWVRPSPAETPVRKDVVEDGCYW